MNISRNNSDEYYHPLDVLYRQNPEIASLVYANSNNLLDSKILPYIAGFRKLQHDEKLALMNEMTKRLGIEADKQKLYKVVDGDVSINSTKEVNETKRIDISEYNNTQRAFNHEKSLTDRIKVQENGLTQRERINNESYQDVMKTKYLMASKMVQDQIDGQRYLSDNEVHSVKIEAEAQRDMLIFTEELKNNTLKQLSKDQLTSKIKSEEIRYLAKIKEAETLREIEHFKGNTSITNNYMNQQADIIKMMLFQEIEKSKAESKNIKNAYNTINASVDKAIQLLTDRKDLDNISITAKTSHTNIDLKIRGTRYDRE